MIKSSQFIYIRIHIPELTLMKFTVQWYLRFARRWGCKDDAREREREITIQREQYEVNVHLFIGAERSPDTITFISLTFTYNNNANDQGLNNIFPLSR
jgi:hypothetical protein